GGAVRRDHADLERHLELGERLCGVDHHRPVAVAAHDEPDPGATCHSVSVPCSFQLSVHCACDSQCEARLARSRTAATSSPGLPTRLTWPSLRPGRSPLP